MRAGETDTPDPVDGADGAQKFGEQRTAPGDVAPVGVDVLTEERDLDCSGVGQLLHLGDDLVEGPADLPAPHRGDDAEGAPVVAADLDRHPGGVGKVAPHGQRGGEGVGLLEDLHDRAFEGRAPQQVGRVADVVGAEDDIDVGRPLLDQPPVLLGQAAADGDLQIGPALLERLQLAEVAVEPVVGVLADAAGVEQDEVGFVDVGGDFHAVGLEQAREPLGVVLVHLTPEGADEVLTGRLRHGTPG